MRDESIRDGSAAVAHQMFKTWRCETIARRLCAGRAVHMSPPQSPVSRLRRYAASAHDGRVGNVGWCVLHQRWRAHGMALSLCPAAAQRKPPCRSAQRCRERQRSATAQRHGVLEKWQRAVWQYKRCHEGAVARAYSGMVRGAARGGSGRVEGVARAARRAFYRHLSQAAGKARRRAPRSAAAFASAATKVRLPPARCARGTGKQSASPACYCEDPPFISTARCRRSPPPPR